jgi:uncharacterized membrane protein
MLSMALAALCWIALHLVVAGPLRTLVVARLGERGFRGLFSLSSAAGLAWLILAYRAADLVPLWGPLPGARVIAIVLVLIAFELLVFSIAPSNPTLAGAELMLKGELAATGMFRITRHPGLWAFALWAAAHLYANGDLASLLLFGAILVTALNGMASIDRKRQRAMGARWEAFAARTSRLPFAAIAAGRNELRLAELSPWRAALALVLFLAALFLHGPVLGVSPLVG